MSKKIGGVLALMGLCALSLFLVNCGSSSSRPSGVLYVLTQGNSGVGNNVTSFAIDLSSGNLSLINSNASTCTPAGSSCGPPLDIVLDPTGATAFVLNQGLPGSAAATIYAYNVNSDGSFGTPSVAVTLSAGDLPLAMARDAAGNFLFVITDAPEILVFSMKPGSTTLTAVDNSALSVTRIPTALSTVTFTPPGSTTSEEFLFVTSNNDPVLRNDNTVSVYSVSSTGVLTEQPNSPYATSTDPISVQAVNTNLAGTGTGGVFVYVGSQPTATGALQAFELCTVVDANCSPSDVMSSLLRPVTGTPPAPGSMPVAMLVDPTNTFLYVVCQGSSQVFGYKISSAGTLAAQSPPSQPTGSRPVAMAMHPSVNASGAFLYTSNNGANNISGFPISTLTGSMGAQFTVNSPSIPSGMAAR
jgi:6-phosphogluconolactonase (cycloisomerase 2 family)